MSTAAHHILKGLAVGLAALGAATATAQVAAPLQQRLTQAQHESVADCSVKTEPHKPVGRTTIYVRSGRTVTIGLQGDETVVSTIWDQAAPGELVAEFVHPDQRSITARLQTPGPVPGVITTTQRRYFVVLVPTEPGPQSLCYQGFLFAGSEGATGGFNPFGSIVAPSPTGVGAPSVSEVMPTARPDNTVFSGAPNFDYAVQAGPTGASIRPVAVYDNGRFTWIQFPSSAQAVPAVFYVGPNGQEVVNVAVLNGGTTLLVNRLMERFILKLGDAEVTVTANRR